MPVPYRLIPARDPRGVYQRRGALWAEPDIGAASDRLVRLADDPEPCARRSASGRKPPLPRGWV